MRNEVSIDRIDVSIQDAANVILAESVNEPVLLLGSPGIGKSAGLEGAFRRSLSAQRKSSAKAWGELVTVIAAIRSPEDILGIPEKRPVGYGYGPFEFLARITYDEWAGEKPDGNCHSWLFLDEITNAVTRVQTALLRLTLERRVEGRVLHPGVRIVLAGNRVEDRAGSGDLITSLGSRITRLDIQPRYDEWRHNFAVPNGVENSVVSFLASKPSLFNAPNPDDGGWGPNPRNWTRVSRFLKEAQSQGLGWDLILAGVAGKVGIGSAREFVAFARLAGEVPTPEEVRRDPKKARLPDSPSALHFTLGSLAAAAIRDLDSAHLDAYTSYALRAPAELQVLFLRDVQSAALEGSPIRPKVVKLIGGARGYLTEAKRLLGHVKSVESEA